jgi:hypothetical protein
MRPLLELYSSAISASDIHVSILYFTKAVEFVSQTVVRQQATEAIRAKLLSPRALSPTADFIMELEPVVDEQRAFKKDREAIKHTVAICCEATELSRIAPNFLTDLKKINRTSKEKERGDALTKLGASLYSTRNSIAHAKANYSPTGEECPAEDMVAFTSCIKVATQQVIRWYGSRPENERLT